MVVKVGVQAIVEKAKSAGASDAAAISAADIAVRNWVRLKCQYGCDEYGKRLTCPPNTPTPQEFKEVLKEYKTALLIKFECSDYGQAVLKARECINQVERYAFLNGYYKAFGLAAGCCPYCKECSLKTCSEPIKARPSMEAVGIDVYETSRRAAFKLEVVENQKDSFTFVGVVLIE